MGSYIARLSDEAHFITGLAPITPSSSTPDYVSLKGYAGMTAVILVDNGDTVTGSAITLHQAKDVGATDEKALAFTKVLQNVATGSGSVLTETAVSSNTFTTVTTNAANAIYVIDVPLDNLDTDNGFDCVRVGTGNAANTVLAVLYILHKPVYSGRTINPILD